MLELLGELPIFIGFKLDGSLRRQLEGLSGPDSKYVSTEDSTYLRICRAGEDKYVGKLIHERLTTERVDDIRRNIVSIMNRILPEVRLPHRIEIVACGTSSEPRSEEERTISAAGAPHETGRRSVGGEW